MNKMNNNYRPRIADEELKQKLVVGAVLIEGPKWCGKTSTAEMQAKSILYMDVICQHFFVQFFKELA